MSSSQIKNIAITSVEGLTGTCIVHALSQGGQSFKICGFSQEPNKVKDLDIKVHNFGSPGDMSSSLKDVDCMILIPPSSGNKVDVTWKYLDAAKQAKLKHVVVVSTLMPRGDRKEWQNCKALEEFWQVEEKVKTCGFEQVCIVRLAFYMENLLLYRDQLQQGQLPLPLGRDDGMCMVSLRDAAIGIMELFKQTSKQHKFPCEVLEFTGSRAWSPQQIAEEASRGSGRKIEYKQISDEEAKRILDKSSFEQRERDLLLDMYKLGREGKYKFTSQDMTKFVGQDQITNVEKFFSEHKSFQKGY
jgi:uncharacterized protein YbjT (DUF2867 family)